MAIYYKGNIPVYSVTEITTIIDRELQSAFFDIWVEGEASDVKISKNGHIYFILKDNESSLRVAFFRNYAVKTPFKIENGMVLLLRGTIGLYTKGGDLQFYATFVEPFGLGALQQKIEQAKKRLMEEGLTSPERKRAIPKFPKNIGVVTSLEGAAIRDFISILRRRGANVNVIISPSSVQGENAVEELKKGLIRLYSEKNFDVIVLMRGGGSMEDLMPFNDESLARLVGYCPVPIISAVGHEIDFLLTDLTADLRAPTPSVAGEILSEGYFTVKEKLNLLEGKMASFIKTKFYITHTKLSVFKEERISLLLKRKLEIIEERFDKSSGSIYNFQNKIIDIEKKVFEIKSRLKAEKILQAILNFKEKTVNIKRETFLKIATKLKEVEGNLINRFQLLEERNPMKILSKGYSILFDRNNKPVSDSDKVEVGEKLPLKLFKGKLQVKIEEKD